MTKNIKKSFHTDSVKKTITIKASKEKVWHKISNITDMSWGRVKHPSNLLNVGDEVDVKILKYDASKERVSLGLKQVQVSDPSPALIVTVASGGVDWMMYLLPPDPPLMVIELNEPYFSLPPSPKNLSAAPAPIELKVTVTWSGVMSEESSSVSVLNPPPPPQ